MAGADTDKPGFLGNLSETQTTALAQLWVLLLELLAKPGDATVSVPGDKGTPKGTPQPSPTSSLTGGEPVRVVTVQRFRTEVWLACQALHPDSFLLRFLRARKFDVAKAYAMLVSAIAWRVKVGVQDVVEHGDALIDKEQFEVPKTYVYKMDRVGHPVIYINVQYHERGKHSVEQLERHTVYMMETARLFLPPGIERVVIVFNMTGFSLSNMDNAMVKFLVTCLQNYYPESLEHCLIVSAPWVFQGVWKLIKGWLDPVVVSKINMIKFQDLTQWIDPQSIPSLCEGQDPWTWRYIPPVSAEYTQHQTQLQDAGTRERLLTARLAAATEFEQATKRWCAAWLDTYPPSTNPNEESVRLVPVPEATRARLRELSDARTKLFEGPLIDTWHAYDAWARFPSPWHRMGVLDKSKPTAAPNWARAGTNGVSS